MRRALKTRHGFFLVAGIICFAMTVVVEAKFRWVTMGVGGLYLLLAVRFFLHDLGQTPLTASVDLEPPRSIAPEAAATAPVPPPPPLRHED